MKWNFLVRMVIQIVKLLKNFYENQVKIFK